MGLSGGAATHAEPPHVAPFLAAAAGQWITAARESRPRDEPPVSCGRPGPQLELEWVHGYRSHDCRQNVHFVAASAAGASRFVYPAASTVVMHCGGASPVQRFFLGHSGPVTALAVYGGVTVASGDAGVQPQVLVWNINCVLPSEPITPSSAALVRLRGLHSVGIKALAFSPSGTLLASLGVSAWLTPRLQLARLSAAFYHPFSFPCRSYP